MHCTRKKINLPNPSPPLQDDISRRGNLDSVLLAPRPRCAVGRYALGNTIRISKWKSPISPAMLVKASHRIRFAPHASTSFQHQELPFPQTSQAPIPLSPPLPLPSHLSTNKRNPQPNKHTFTRNITRHTPSTTQPHLGDFPLRRIRFLGLHDAHLEAHGLHMRAVDQGGGDGVAGALGGARSAADLVEGRVVGWGGREGLFVVVVVVMVLEVWGAWEVDGVGGTDGSRDDEGAEGGEEGERWGWWHGWEGIGGW